MVAAGEDHFYALQTMDYTSSGDKTSQTSVCAKLGLGHMGTLATDMSKGVHLACSLTQLDSVGPA